MAGFFAAGSAAMVVAVEMFLVGEMGDIVVRASALAWTLGLGVIGLALAATIYAVTHPSRGLQDRLAGTWLVPR